MATPNEKPGTFPAEGRPDVAADLEEEQRNAYSAHHKQGAAQKKRVVRKNQPREDQEPPPDAASLYPVEGRDDIAADFEEEQRNAYSSHHANAGG